VIDEIMTDPKFSVGAGLPQANEWNLSYEMFPLLDINLHGWTLNDLTGQTGNNAQFILQPDSL